MAENSAVYHQRNPNLSQYYHCAEDKWLYVDPDPAYV